MKMKLMIASDIHGSAYYCSRLMSAYEREKPDKLLLLGDILYHGPRNDLPRDYDPKKVIAMLNSIADNIICIRGNCDTQVDQMVLDFDIMAEYAYIFADGVTFFASHGHVYNKSCPPKTKGVVLLNGHTHVPEYGVYDSFTYVNCGSVSIPKESTPHTYMIFTERCLYWKDLSGECCRKEYLPKREAE